MKIQVTAEDIRRGRPGICGGCPIALAMRRAFGVPIESWRFVSSTNYSALPQVATVFVVDFDAGRPVQPIEFEVPDA